METKNTTQVQNPTCDFPEVMLEECIRLRRRLLEDGFVAASESKFAELLAEAIKARCQMSERTLWMKFAYWANTGGVYARCGVREALYDEFGERFGCRAYGLLFIADLAETWEVLTRKGEIKVLI
jgi:hypothetical protein